MSQLGSQRKQRQRRLGRQTKGPAAKSTSSHATIVSVWPHATLCIQAREHYLPPGANKDPFQASPHCGHPEQKQSVPLDCSLWSDLASPRYNVAALCNAWAARLICTMISCSDHLRKGHMLSSWEEQFTMLLQQCIWNILHRHLFERGVCPILRRTKLASKVTSLLF